MAYFSLIIPVFNRPDEVNELLESLTLQRCKDFEVIVIDDDCTDKSIEIAKEFDVKIIKTKHVSVSQARNLGIKEAKGEYLVFFLLFDLAVDRIIVPIYRQ